MRQVIALFGEAEKGEFSRPIRCKNVIQLAENLGNPPEESLGIYLAIQMLLYEKELLFFRVKEEGFSAEDYLKGLNVLKQGQIETISALCLPGVGDHQILDATDPICRKYQTILITRDIDLYDYLTHTQLKY